MSIHVRSTKSGRRYDVRLRDPGGRGYTRSFPTKKEAEQFEAREKADRSRGAWVDPRAGTITLGEWATQWLEHRPDLRARTRELYATVLRRHVLPTLGTTQLGKLTPSQVRAWHTSLSGPNGPGQSTAAKAYRLLRAVLNTAVTDELILRNPCQVKGAGLERAPERPVATIAQVHALAEAMPERWQLLILLAAWCGLRRGELLALQRGDIDLAAGTVAVRRAVQQLSDGRLLVGEPKTAAGRRVVATPPHLHPAVEHHLATCVGPESGDLLFTGEKGGVLRPHVLQKAWDEARRATGMPGLHLHDLRHSGNTWAAATGASTRELMARMGHADAAAALRYQHATSDRDRAIAEALSALVPSRSPASATVHRTAEA